MHALVEAGVDLATARTFLFVPADDPRRLRKALASEADAVIADLEDAVAAERKDAARETLVAELASLGRRARGALLVRVNAPATAAGAADARALRGLPVDGVVVPKAEPGALDALAGLGVPLIALVETPAGLRGAYELARDDGVARLMLGTIDLALALRLGQLDDGGELLHARSRLVLDSAAAGLPAPIDGVVADVADELRLRVEARRARALGFGAKACIHPRQLPVVAAAFRPTADEVAWARRIIDAYDRAGAAGRGATLVDGEMVDAPVVARARRLLEDADA